MYIFLPNTRHQTTYATQFTHIVTKYINKRDQTRRTKSQTRSPSPIPKNTNIPRTAEGLRFPTAALIGGAAVVVAGLTVFVAVAVFGVVVFVVCVVVWWVDDVEEGLLVSAAEDAEDADEDRMLDKEDVDVEVMIVVKVLDLVDIVESVAVGFADDTPEEVEVAEPTPVDKEIRLPPLESTVTVCCPLTTIVDAVIVVCGCPLLCDTPELVVDVEAELATVDEADPLVLVVVKSNEYVVFGNKELGNVANADESTVTALVVCVSS
ncbi:hypothetical protein KCU65_g6162, partial [Aureobasidium melanogenum]